MPSCTAAGELTVRVLRGDCVLGTSITGRGGQYNKIEALVLQDEPIGWHICGLDDHSIIIIIILFILLLLKISDIIIVIL